MGRNGSWTVMEMVIENNINGLWSVMWMGIGLGMDYNNNEPWSVMEMVMDDNSNFYGIGNER